MFSPSNMFKGMFVSVFLFAVFYTVDGMYLNVTDTLTIPLHLEFLIICTFVASLFFAVMYVFGSVFTLLFSFGFLADWQSSYYDPTFTRKELMDYDLKDCEQWNETQLQVARAQGEGSRYVDYAGFVRDAFTGQTFGYDHERDQRRIVDGKVSDKYVLLKDGFYHHKQIEKVSD